MTKKKAESHQLLAFSRELFEGSVLFGADAPLRAQLTEGDEQSKVLLLTGSNASGKSFAVQVLASWLNDEKPSVEPLQVSMKYRTTAGMHRAFMYGGLGDSQNSTGTVSMHALSGGLRTARGRDTPCWLMLDEPDTGLSEDFGHAVGTYIATEANTGLGDKCNGLVVVTHSRELVRGLLDTLAHKPHFVHVGEPALSLNTWLEKPERRSVEELLGLDDKAHKTFRAINAVLDKRKAAN